jgi:dTDP-4-amino-4,6-dideoxygalactose transaminase
MMSEVSATRYAAEPRINVMQPWMGDDEVAAAAQVLQSGWIAQGPRVAEFEQLFAASVDAPHAVAVSSCTTALHLALIVAGIGSGDDVVVPSFSFIATTNVVVHVGATPVFADVDAETGNVTPATIGAALTPRTRAVIAVDQGGVPADIDAIRALCDPLEITVIEDAACAAGSLYRGRPVGTSAEISAWSFHPRKILTTGEGGMVTTMRAEWAERARRLREHAMSVSAAERHASLVSPPEEYSEVGYNFRMTDLQAAVGIVQLGKLQTVVNRRRELARAYQTGLSHLADLRTVDDPPGARSNYQSFWVELEGSLAELRDDLLTALAARNISARRGIMAAHLQPAYASLDHGPLPNTERLTRSSVILPLFHVMTGADQDRVISTIASWRAGASG